MRSESPTGLRSAARASMSATTAVSAVAALVALGVLWESRLAPLRPGGSWMILKVLPLAILFIPMLRKQLRAFQGLSLLIQLYLCEGVVRLFSDAQPFSRTLAGLELALSAVAFAATLIHIQSRRDAALSVPIAR
jgi:uncharacterized membrane protein